MIRKNMSCMEKGDRFHDFFVLWNWAVTEEWWDDFLYWVFQREDLTLIRIVDRNLFPELLLQFGKEKLGW